MAPFLEIISQLHNLMDHWNITLYDDFTMK